jgi:hypothetical protein
MNERELVYVDRQRDLVAIPSVAGVLHGKQEIKLLWPLPSMAPSSGRRGSLVSSIGDPSAGAPIPAVSEGHWTVRPRHCVRREPRGCRQRMYGIAGFAGYLCARGSTLLACRSDQRRRPSHGASCTSGGPDLGRRWSSPPLQDRRARFIRQIVKIKGCRAVDMAGGAAKAATQARIDATVDHKEDPSPPCSKSLPQNGIDVYVDDIRREILEARLPLTPIVRCGGARRRRRRVRTACHQVCSCNGS